MKQSKSEHLKSNKVRRNLAIQARYKELYNKERLRFEDVKNKLAEEFYLSGNTIMRVLNLNLSPVSEV